MKRTFLIIIAIALTAFASFAQIKDTTYWNKNFEAGINLNQAGFSHDWKTAQGGLNNIALSAFLFAKSEYVHNRSKMVNDLQMQYGRVLTDNVEDYKHENVWRKNVDRIFFDNIFTHALTPTIGAFASATFQTQFDKGFRFDKTLGDTTGGIIHHTAGLDSATRVSNFLAPGTLIEGLGIEWTPVEYFSLRAAPIAFRQSFSTDAIVTANVADATGMHLGVKPGMKIKNDFGLNVLAKFDKDLATNINLKVMGQYFSAYENMAVGTLRFDIIFTAKITKFINVNLTGVVLYNQTQIARFQASEQLALGLAYKFTNIPVTK